jgi:hypothetical protein
MLMQIVNKMYKPLDKSNAIEQIGKTKEWREIKSTPGSAEFAKNLDSILLKHIYEQIGLELPEDISKDVDNWDRRYLGNLAVYIPHFIDNPDAKLKLQQAILLKDDPQNPMLSQIQTYNQIVRTEMTRLGCNLEFWLNSEDHIIHVPSVDGSYHVDLKPWSRNFKKEYALGNISECCVAINGSDKHLKYKRIWADYFLDETIQAIHLTRVEHETGKVTEIGQIYLAALYQESEKGINSMLGISSVELKEEYKADLSLVPIILEGVCGSYGFMQQYGFSSTLVGPKLKYSIYMRDKKAELKSLLGLVRDRLRKNKEKLKELTTEEEIQEHMRLIETLSRERTTANLLLDGFYEPNSIPYKKVGLNQAIFENCTYLGTNYLDILNNSDRHIFFNPRAIPSKIKGHVMSRNSNMDQVTAIIKALRAKYTKKKIKN